MSSNTPQPVIKPSSEDDSLSGFASIKGVNPTYLIIPDSIQFAQPIRVYLGQFTVNLKFKTMDTLAHQGAAYGNYQVQGGLPKTSIDQLFRKTHMNQVSLNINGFPYKFIRPGIYPLMSLDVRAYFNDGKSADFTRTDNGFGQILQYLNNPNNLDISIYPSDKKHNFMSIIRSDECIINYFNSVGFSVTSGQSIQKVDQYVTKLQIKVRMKLAGGEYVTFVDFIGNCSIVYKSTGISTFGTDFSVQMPQSFDWINNNLN